VLHKRNALGIHKDIVYLIAKALVDPACAALPAWEPAKKAHRQTKRAPDIATVGWMIFTIAFAYWTQNNGW
jgi:hypothetical protein